VVEWVSPAKFLFIPDAQNSLTFGSTNNEVIRPERFNMDEWSMSATQHAINSYLP